MTAAQITIKALNMSIDPFYALHNELEVTQARIKCLMTSDEHEIAAYLIIQDITKVTELEKEIRRVAEIL